MIDKYIDKFCEISLKLDEVSDFFGSRRSEASAEKSNKYSDRLDSIINKVYDLKREDEFFERLFCHDNFIVRKWIIGKSDDFRYNFYKTLDALLDLQKEDKNNQIYSKDNYKIYIEQIRNKIAFYEKVNDDKLYRQLFNYLLQVSRYMTHWLYFKEKKSQECWEQAKSIVEEVRADGKLDKFFNLTFEVQDNAVKITNALISADIGYDIERSKNVLKSLVAGGTKSLNPRMLKFCQEHLEKMDAM